MDHRQRARSWVIFALLAALYGAMTAMAPVAIASDHGCEICQGGDNPPETHGNQDHGSLITTAGLFPHAGPDSRLGQASAENASCTDCEWNLTPMCMQNRPGDDAMCQNAATACPPPAVFYRVYLRHGSGPWLPIDTICLGPGEGPVSSQQIGDRVREVVENYLPDARPSFQPAQGGLVNLPTLFAAGEPESVTTDEFRVLGFMVVVSATAHWDWTFEPGIERGFDKPGGDYPNDDVSYTYATSGSRDVTLTTSWQATFTIDGGGPHAVPGAAITKTVGPIAVPVREAHAALIGD